ncbi:hypothetical protein [Haloechinothrix sp. LS1_15]|uniref:hypothetical protein n=1 Tax=Haloechinothrix sp. LS1_15 TaxID=2652248 RepID=UPI002944FA6A|nr:hypothetical protein [Haloechinothrix sp. LS1_15]MDV6013843.1 hypothetical protein [Haloechinothrix sp. LS1_15]
MNHDTAATAPATEDTAATGAPRLFALAPAGSELEAGDAVFWGIAFGDHAMAYRRDPDTGFREQGICESAEEARRLFSSGEPEPLRLIWF